MSENECEGVVVELEMEIAAALIIINEICEIANSHPEYEELQKYFLHLAEFE